MNKTLYELTFKQKTILTVKTLKQGLLKRHYINPK